MSYPKKSFLVVFLPTLVVAVLATYFLVPRGLMHVSPPYFIWRFSLGTKIHPFSNDTVYPPAGWGIVNDTGTEPHLTFTPNLAPQGPHSITFKSWTPGADSGCTPIVGMEANITDNLCACDVYGSLPYPPPTSFIFSSLRPGASYFIISPLSVLNPGPPQATEPMSTITYTPSGPTTGSVICTDVCGNVMYLTIN